MCSEKKEKSSAVNGDLQKWMFFAVPQLFYCITVSVCFVDLLKELNNSV